MILRLRPNLKLVLRFNWKALDGCSHGPQTWPWWRPIGFLVCRLDTRAPSFGWRLWWYTRRGGRTAELYVDRREPLL